VRVRTLKIRSLDSHTRKMHPITFCHVSNAQLTFFSLMRRQPASCAQVLLRSLMRVQAQQRCWHGGKLQVYKEEEEDK